MDVDVIFSRLNPLLIALLHSPLHFLASAGLMTLAYEGRRSGRRVVIPVGYQREGDRIEVLVSKALRKKWWRNFEAPRGVELRVRGQRLEGRARLLAAEDPAFRTAFERTFDRMPLLPKQFDIPDYQRREGLTPDQLDRVTRDGRVVCIDIGPGEPLG